MREPCQEERLLGPNHADTLGTVKNLALLLHHQGKLDDAKKLWERALKILKEKGEMTIKDRDTMTDSIRVSL